MFRKEPVHIRLICLKLTKIIKGKKGVINQDILRMVEGILRKLPVDLL